MYDVFILNLKTNVVEIICVFSIIKYQSGAYSMFKHTHTHTNINTHVYIAIKHINIGYLNGLLKYIYMKKKQQTTKSNESMISYICKE